MFYSPLRYPGGKQKLSKFIAQVCVDNSINGHYIEPYAGGASVALYLLFEGKVKEITINDFDKSVYAFWWAVLNRPEQLIKLISETSVTPDTWKEMKALQKNKNKARLLELGFSTLFLNRTNRSGILNAGMIGGHSQSGEYKIDCRFNKDEIITRIKNIAQKKHLINLTNKDAIDLINDLAIDSGKDSIFYFDPPYYLKGPGLYLNAYKHDDHAKVSAAIKKIKKLNWIVSYDNHDQIKTIYDWVPPDKIVEFDIQHSAHTNRKGREVLFFSNSLKKVDLLQLQNL